MAMTLNGYTMSDADMRRRQVDSGWSVVVNNGIRFDF